MHVRKLFGMGAVLLLSAAFAVAQQAGTTQIKHVPVKGTNAASGQEMYASYCAVCHGANATGNGPAQSALKTPATDLHVSSVLRGDAELAAHGSKDMPVWGPLFRNLSQGHDAEVQQRIANINSYIESLQKK
jgi:mono/diheme cytochrome c family protein